MELPRVLVFETAAEPFPYWESHPRDLAQVRQELLRLPGLAIGSRPPS